MIINWITIHVKSLEKSKKFYSGYLGLKLKNTMLPMECFFVKDPDAISIQIIK